jgi:O-antigen/teichoic acid export membrane protein
LILCVSFFSRKVFLDSLGADFVGLTGTLGELMSLLNIAELGIGTAIGYLLYKPLFEQNHEKINEIISVLGYLYRWIGGIILVAGCILACFLPLIFPRTGFDFTLIYAAYFAFLGSSLIGYYINYRASLLGADQRNYVVTAYYQSLNIFKTLLQLGLAYYTGNYYLWVIVEFSTGVIYSFILNWKINQTYPWLKSDIALGRQLFKKYPEVIKYTKQIFVHQFTALLQFKTSQFFIYAFASLSTVTYYNNYNILIDRLQSLLNNFFGSVSAGVGNLIAEGNKTKILRVFWELFSVRIWVAGVCIYGLVNYTDAFISLWLGEEYLLSHWVLYLILTRFFISVSRATTDAFIWGYGLFYDTWAPIAESAIYVVVSLIGGYYLGLTGVILGNIISLSLIVVIWKPIFLFRCGLKLPLLSYWKEWFKYTLLMVGVIYMFSEFLDYFELKSDITSCWSTLIVKAIYQTAIFSSLFFGVLYTCSPFRCFVKRFIRKRTESV